MWMVDKLHRGTEAARERVPASILEPLLRWYTGRGTDVDEASAVSFVRAAKLYQRWLACDCLGDTVAPPLLSPVLLTEVQTYYLRRLTGSARPEHRPDCPFHRDQANYALDRTRSEALPLVAPEGYFAVLKPAAEHLAQRPDGEERDRLVRPSAPPLLARLLWRLIDDAGTNVVEAIGDRPAPAIYREFHRLKAAAANIEVAPGRKLDQLLVTHPDDIHSRQIYARLRKAAEIWPTGHEPQAFALLFVTAVTDHDILFAKGEPIGVIGKIKRPLQKQIDTGPYLVIVAIGHHPLARGYAPIEAWAQPIHDGRHFIPVETNAERAMLKMLLDEQWQLRDAGVLTRIKKPLFDVDPDLTPCRPSFLVANHSRADRSDHLQAIRLAPVQDGSFDASQTVSLAAIADDVICIETTALDDPNRIRELLRERRKATDFLTATAVSNTELRQRATASQPAPD